MTRKLILHNFISISLQFLVYVQCYPIFLLWCYLNIFIFIITVITSLLRWKINYFSVSIVLFIDFWGLQWNVFIQSLILSCMFLFKLIIFLLLSVTSNKHFWNTSCIYFLFVCCCVCIQATSICTWATVTFYFYGHFPFVLPEEVESKNFLFWWSAL